MQNTQESKNFDETEVTSCPHCFCSTHTIIKFGNFCGKCGKDKDTQKTVEELGWVRVLAKSKNKNDLDLLVAKIHVLVSQEKATLKKQIREEIFDRLEQVDIVGRLEKIGAPIERIVQERTPEWYGRTHELKSLLSLPLLKVEEDKKEE